MTITTGVRLYNVTSVIDRWPHRRSRWNGVQVTWFVTKRATDPGFDYGQLLDRPLPPGDEYSCERGLVDESFTQDEAERFAAYLESTYDTEAKLQELPLPVATRSAEGYELLPVGAIAVGGDSDFHMLSEHETYDLPFSVWGYYCMMQNPAPLRVVDLVKCPHHGDEEIAVDPPVPYWTTPAEVSGPGVDFDLPF
jgi:hypothetical protein